MDNTISRFCDLVNKYPINDDWKKNWSLDNGLFNLIYGMNYEQSVSVIAMIQTIIEPLNNAK